MPHKADPIKDDRVRTPYVEAHVLRLDDDLNGNRKPCGAIYDVVGEHELILERDVFADVVARHRHDELIVRQVRHRKRRPVERC